MRTRSAMQQNVQVRIDGNKKRVVDAPTVQHCMINVRMLLYGRWLSFELKC